MRVKEGIATWVCGLWKGKDNQERAGRDERCCDPVDHPPTVDNGDEATDHDAAADASRERERTDGHDRSSLVQEEDIGNGQLRHNLGCSRCKTHDDARCEFAAVGGSSASPSCARQVQGEREHVDWSSAVLDDDGHPEQSAHTLHQGRGGEEIGSFRDISAGIRVRLRSSEVHRRHRDDVDGWSCSQEVAEGDSG